MVADRQHLSNSDESAPVVTSSKKVRSNAPLNIYRPPALRKKNEVLEISSNGPEPEIVAVAKAEKLRPAKQRRPDIQVYVPRAKRILAVPEGNSKATATLSCTQSKNRKTASPRKSGATTLAKPFGEKEPSETTAKSKTLGDRSSQQQVRTISNEKNQSILASADLVTSDRVTDSCETIPDLSSDISHRCDLITCDTERAPDLQGKSDFKVTVEHKDVDAIEQVAGTHSDHPLSLDKSNDLRDDLSECDRVQQGSDEYLEINECRTDLSSCLCAESVSEPVLESVKHLRSLHQDVASCCKTCNSILRLCQCSGVRFVENVNDSFDQSTCSLDSSSSENVANIQEGCVSVEETSSDQNKFGSELKHQGGELCSLDNINVSDIETSGQNVQNLFLQEENAISSVMRCTSEDENIKNSHVSKDRVSSDVHTISDSSNGMATEALSNNTKKLEEDGDNVLLTNAEETLATPSSENSVPLNSTPIRLNPDECTWEMMFDDNGDCLDPKLIEEITNAVGSVKFEKPKSDYNSYQNKPEILLDPGDEFSHVIEVYNFPAAFKTEDLVTIFSPYKNGGFEIKWVDNTHALGIFSSAFVAAEVLAAEHPFVKTRPLREASHESRMKARRSAEFLQPYKVRPETCAALARRLVTGALGVKLSTSREEREAERRVLREAREKKRLAAKQRDEIWEGTFSTN